MRAHKWAVLRRGVRHAAIGRPSRYTYHITRERCAVEVRHAYVRAHTRARVRANAHASRAYLEKRTVSLSPVCRGCGNRFRRYADMLAQMYAYIHMYKYSRIIARNAICEAILRMRHGHFATFYFPGVTFALRGSRKYPGT